MTYQLYYTQGDASLLPHMMLREIGAPFDLRPVDRDANAQRSPAYLALNPSGRIPVLIDGTQVLYETVAIALYLTERHPEAALAPAPGTPGRADFLIWMSHLANTPQPEYRAWFYPAEHVVDPAAAATVKHAAGDRLTRMFAIIAAQLGDGPYLLGDRFSAADLYLLMLVRWGRTLPTPLGSLPTFAAHARRVLARPAVQATFAAEALSEPFV